MFKLVYKYSLQLFLIGYIIAGHKQIKGVKNMFIMKSNFKTAAAIAGLTDLKLLKRVGIVGILKQTNSKAILQRLVNSDLVSEGNYS